MKFKSVIKSFSIIPLIFCFSSTSQGKITAKHLTCHSIEDGFLNLFMRHTAYFCTDENSPNRDLYRATVNGIGIGFTHEDVSIHSNVHFFCGCKDFTETRSFLGFEINASFFNGGTFTPIAVGKGTCHIGGMNKGIGLGVSGNVITIEPW